MSTTVTGGRLGEGTGPTAPPWIEPYAPRGIGVGYAPCFVCGSDEVRDLAAFVPDRATGERVVAIFQKERCQAILDYRPAEPDWVQVKIGTCQRHLPCLERLYDLTRHVHHITREVIAAALLVTQ